MRTFIQNFKKATLAIAIILFSTVAFAKKQDVKKVETVVFNIAMDCQGCVKKINKNIAFEKGVKEFNVDFENQKLSLTYKTNATTKEILKKALEKLDFKVSEVKK